jgi:hypothetical protein
MTNPTVLNLGHQLTANRPHSDNPHGEPRGRALLDGGQCPCGDEIRAGDLVAANFDKRHVHSGGGLYLVQSADGWRGCRRMMRVPEGIAIDQDGHGDWVTVPSMDAAAWRVVGVVETVYRPTRYQ